MKGRKKSIIWLCLTVGIIFCTAVFLGPAKVKAGEKVRVGMYSNEGYHMADTRDRHNGYDYEYLTEIAKYTGWEYEYIEGTWQECTDMLERGEIDLLGGLEKREERQETMKFASEPSAYVGNCLMVSKHSESSLRALLFPLRVRRFLQSVYGTRNLSLR